MWQKKKLIAIAVLAGLMVAGTIGGVVLAADNGDNSEPETKHEALLNRVCEIYQEKTGIAIDQVALKDAFAQVKSEMKAKALEDHLAFLVEQDKITQEQANDYLEWWQERPDIPAGFGFSGRCGFRGMGGLRGMRSFGWPCTPAE